MTTASKSKFLYVHAAMVATMPVASASIFEGAPRAVLFSRTAPPPGWTAVGPATANATYATADSPVFVPLNPLDPAALPRALDRVSDPNSPAYGEWLTKEQVLHHVRPSPGALEVTRPLTVPLEPTQRATGYCHNPPSHLPLIDIPLAMQEVGAWLSACGVPRHDWDSSCDPCPLLDPRHAYPLAHGPRPAVGQAREL
eukprot:gene9636-8601_t